MQFNGKLRKTLQRFTWILLYRKYITHTHTSYVHKLTHTHINSHTYINTNSHTHTNSHTYIHKQGMNTNTYTNYAETHKPPNIPLDRFQLSDQYIQEI